MKRPVLVTIIGVLGIVGGIVQTIFGAIVVGLRNDQKLLADADITSGTATAIGIACIVVGIASVLLSIGLLRGSRALRAVLGISQLVQIALSIYALVSLDASRRMTAIGTIVSGLVVLYLLFGTEKAKAFFAKH